MRRPFSQYPNFGHLRLLLTTPSDHRRRSTISRVRLRPPCPTNPGIELTLQPTAPAPYTASGPPGRSVPRPWPSLASVAVEPSTLTHVRPQGGATQKPYRGQCHQSSLGAAGSQFFLRPANPQHPDPPAGVSPSSTTEKIGPSFDEPIAANPNPLGKAHVRELPI